MIWGWGLLFGDSSTQIVSGRFCKAVQSVLTSWDDTKYNNQRICDDLTVFSTLSLSVFLEYASTTNISKTKNVIV